MNHVPRWIAAMLVLGGLACLALDASAGDEKVTKVNEKNDGDKIKLTKGATLEIRLKSNRTTGFSWSIAKSDKEIIKQMGDVKYERPAKGAIGAGGTDVITFTAEKAGTSEVELAYKRPFEKDTPPAKTFKLTVTVE